MFTATLRVTGEGRLADFRERVRWLMVREPDAEDYTEHHAEGVLEYRFTLRTGIPFPAFTLASSEFPELRVEAEWDHDGERGRALMENGRLVQQAPEQAETHALDVEVGEDARLVLGMVCQVREGECIGYAATHDRHTFFRFRSGALELVEPEHPDAELEELAFGFVEDWIWYDEEDAPLERARYAGYGYPVRGANLKSEKLARLRRSGERYSSLDDAALEAREALRAQWLNRK